MGYNVSAALPEAWELPASSQVLGDGCSTRWSIPVHPSPGMTAKLLS